MWHVSSRSGVATLRTAIHLLLTCLLTYLRKPKAARSVYYAHMRCGLMSGLVAHGGYEAALVADVEDALALGEPAGQQVLLGRLELLDAL